MSALMSPVAIRAAAVIAFCLATSPLPAATEFSSRVWQMENGLPHGIVQAILQTHDGYHVHSLSGAVAKALRERLL